MRYNDGGNGAPHDSLDASPLAAEGQEMYGDGNLKARYGYCRKNDGNVEEASLSWDAIAQCCHLDFDFAPPDRRGNWILLSFAAVEQDLRYTFPVDHGLLTRHAHLHKRLPVS